MSKWKVISMDIMVGFPLTSRRNDAIMVIVDKLTKMTNFNSIKETYNISNVTQVFISEIETSFMPRLIDIRVRLRLFLLYIYF